MPASVTCQSFVDLYDLTVMVYTSLYSGHIAAFDWRSSSAQQKISRF